MWFRRRRYYAAFRNWFWITNALAVVGYWLYPLAPPRLTGPRARGPHQGTLELGGALSWFQPFRNEFAAMPSMHVGYTFLFALTLVLAAAPLAVALARAAVARRHALRGRGHREPLAPRRRSAGSAPCSSALAIASPLCRGRSRGPGGTRSGA